MNKDKTRISEREAADADPAPASRYGLSVWHLVAVGLLAAVVVVVGLLPVWHTDIWAHLKYGQWLVEQGQLPEHEPFCDRADQSAPYVNFQWLSQLAFYFGFHLGASLADGDELQRLAGGAELLRTLHASLLVLRWGLLLAAFRRVTGSMPLALIGLVVTMLLSLANFAVIRPQVFAEVLFAGLLMSLSKPVLSRTTVVIVPLLMALWANTHGSFPVGLLTLGLWFLGHGLDVLVATHSLKAVLADLAVRRLLLTLLLSAAAVALLNPHGPRLLAHAFALSQHPNIADMDEWQPLRWGHARTYLFAGSVALVLLKVALRISRRRTTEPWFIGGWLLLALFGVETYLHQRLMPWWALLLPWVLLHQLKGGELVWNGGIEAANRPNIRWTVLAGALIVLALRFSGPVQLLVDREVRPLEKLLHAGTPWQLAAQLKGQCHDLPALDAWLKEQPGGQFRGRIFTSETQGDYLLWSLPPDMPIFMYTHVHLFPREGWQECQRVKSGTPDWQAILDSHDVRLIVFECEQHPALRAHLLGAKDRWSIVLDETGSRAKPDARARLLVAVRRL